MSEEIDDDSPSVDVDLVGAGHPDLDDELVGDSSVGHPFTEVEENVTTDTDSEHETSDEELFLKAIAITFNDWTNVKCIPYTHHLQFYCQGNIQHAWIGKRSSIIQGSSNITRRKNFR